MKRLGRGTLLLWAVATASAAGAAVDCRRVGSAMEAMICRDPAVAGRDDALGILYAAALRSPVAPRIQAEQRNWLHGSAMACSEPRCLVRAYDERIGRLMQGPGGRLAARRFHWERGPSNGDATILIHHGWITVDIAATSVGSGGVAGGDVGAARFTSTARLSGNAALATDASGCRVRLARLSAGWMVRQEGCDFGTGSLDGLYREVG